MTDASHLRVAVAQIDSSLGNLRGNTNKHLDFIRQAADSGVEVLLFPELSLTGYGLGAGVPDVALPREHEIIKLIAQAAPGITVLIGFVEEGPAAQFFNSMAALRDGRLVFIHRKLNLPTYGSLEEGKLFASGSYVETFPVHGRWRGGVMICADLWNPALVHLAMVHGTTLLFAPLNSAEHAVSDEFSNPKSWDTVLRFYAIMYAMPILVANRVGNEHGSLFWGQSRILDPHGEILAQADEASECLIPASIDYEMVRQTRFQLPTVRDSNLDLVHREVARLASHTGVPEFIRHG
ncbi:MAG: N-carbamoyl-D-amino acid hydrolase [Gammaproteobacteria bacterium]|nr:N-carbamoyl-D-amino acid hydrolase [Gammaproteobacteria bacterium]